MMDFELPKYFLKCYKAPVVFVLKKAIIHWMARLEYFTASILERLILGSKKNMMIWLIWRLLNLRKMVFYRLIQMLKVI